MSKQLITLSDVMTVLTADAARGSSDFDLNPDVDRPWPTTHPLRPAAVLMPLIEKQGELRVILTKRASHLKHHPGQIAFPGGKVDESDADHTAAATREAYEEIGLSPENVDILGVMPFHHTVTQFLITPVVGHVKEPFHPIAEEGEVAEVFEVPLSYLASPKNYLVESRFWGGERRHYYVIPYGPYYIWGATARILRGFADRIVT